MAPRRDAHDEARLLPRFHDRARLRAEQARVLRKAVRDAVDEGRELTFPAAAGVIRVPCAACRPSASAGPVATSPAHSSSSTMWNAIS